VYMTTPQRQSEPTPSGKDMTYEAPQTLKKSEGRFRLADRAEKMFAYDWDPATDVVAIPGECAFVLGLRVTDKITGKQILAQIHPDDRERVKTALTGLDSENPCVQTGCRILHPDRGVIWVETNSCAFFDDAGKIRRITGMVADITASKLSEAELAIANERLHLAMKAGKSVAWHWDVRSGQDTWSGDLQTIFGIPSNTYIGHVEDFRRRVHPEDRGLVWKAVNDAMVNQTPYTAEFRIVREDRTIRWVAAQGKFYYQSDGEPERMLGIAFDITERKGAEEALRQKEIELANAQRLAQVGSWQWDAESDTVVWSEELYRIYDCDPRLPAVNYKNHPQLFTPESWERLRLAVEEALRTGTPYELELELSRISKPTRWVIARGEAQHDSAGRIVQLHGTVQDITERRHSREALRESEERLRLAAQAGRMYAYEWDRASDEITRSAEFAHILGVSGEPKNTTCQKMLTTVHPDDRARVVAATYGCTPEDPTCRVQYRVVRPDGSEIWLEKNARAFFDGKGKMVRKLGMISDITERKIAEEAISSLSRRLIEAQEAERSRIARDLHDDIGQRLALLSVSIEQTKRSTPDSGDEVRRRMDDLRQQVLDISAGIHALSHGLHSSKLRHLDLVNAMRGFCAELSAQQKVEIHFGDKDIPETVPEEISTCLFRVLQEGLHNAVKHSGVSQFDVELLGTSDAVYLTVSDSGLGFDPAIAMNGRGLGLISMQERLKLVAGELSIKSHPTVGTTIHARVPFSPASVPEWTSV
jgi:PAS domain S-box-containing protein